MIDALNYANLSNQKNTRDKRHRKMRRSAYKYSEIKMLSSAEITEKAELTEESEKTKSFKGSERAFTIVELVIVMAVIGVLMAVMIPVFSGLVKRAENAAKKSELRDANMVMTMILQSAAFSNRIFEDGIITMSEAITAYTENGYELEAEELIWDIYDNHFVFTEDTDTIIHPGDTVDGVFPRYWKAVRTAETAEAAAKEGYGVMLMQCGAADAGGDTGEITVSYSIDTGICGGLERIVYENSNDSKQTAILITGEGQYLTIDARRDTVYHYNEAREVTVESVDSHSYHEFGNVEKLIINDGHMVAESGGKISTVIADVKNKEQKVSIELKGGTIKELKVTHENKEFVDFPETISPKTIISAEDPTEYTEADGTENAPFEISNFSQLTEAVGKANGMDAKDPTIFCKLTEDFTLEITEEAEEYIKLMGNASLSLDFNGHSLIADLTFWLEGNAELTLNDSKKSEMRADSSRFNLSLGENTNTGYYFEVHGNSRLTVNYVKCDWTVNFVYIGDLSVRTDIYDGTFNEYDEIFSISDDIINSNEEISEKTVRLRIYGGEFPSNPSQFKVNETNQVINCLAPGYTFTLNGDIYTVVKNIE